jgi:hypothetical protein
MGLPVFLGEVPAYSCDVGGRVRIIMGDFEMVMPQHVFLEGCARGKRAIVAWQNKQTDERVIPFSLGAGS